MSNGRGLYGIGVKQAVCLRAADIDKDLRNSWVDSYPKKKNRAKPIPDNALLLVLSQDCDIAASDNDDNSIELALCKPINDSKVWDPNKFAHSVRKLHFQCDSKWYEAKVDYILTVEKKFLLGAYKSKKYEVLELSESDAKVIPVWRANRYSRVGLPDEFNRYLSLILKSHIEQIQETSKASGCAFPSYVFALYVRVEKVEGSEALKFEFFALLRKQATDDLLIEIQDIVEALANSLEEMSGFRDVSTVYAGRENNTTVDYLSGLSRLNLDNESLKNGDDGFQIN